MNESDFLSVENDAEFDRILSIYQEMQRTGKTIYLEDYELADLADYYDEKRDDKNLEQVIELSDSMHPDSYEIAYTRGRFLLRHLRLDEVHENIEKMQTFAHNLQTEGDTDYYNEVISEIYLLKGETALMYDTPRRADKIFRKAIEAVLPKEGKTYIAIWVASIYRQYKLEEYAIKWMEHSSKLIPGEQRILELLSSYYSNRKDVKKAEKILNQLLDSNPYSTYYWILMGDTYLTNDLYEKAVEAYDFALVVDEYDPEALKKKAIACTYLGNYEKGAQILNEYLKYDPNDFDALLISANCLSCSGQVPAAIELLERAIEENDSGKDIPDEYRLNLFRQLVCTYRMNEEFDKAIECTDKAIEIGLDKTVFHIMKGGIYMRQEMEKEAIQFFNMAVTEATDPTAALYEISNELFFCDKYELCQGILLHIYETAEKGKFPSTPSMLAYCYLHLRKYDEYLRFLEEACRETPKETKTIFSDIIPEEMSPEEFYESERERLS